MLPENKREIMIMTQYIEILSAGNFTQLHSGQAFC